MFTSIDTYIAQSSQGEPDDVLVLSDLVTHSKKSGDCNFPILVLM